MDSVRIFDTTLRDGEQSPGATMTSEEKVEVARALSRLGVDIIEAGFPAASPDDWEAVHKIATVVGTEEIKGRIPGVCGLARTTRNDIDRAWTAVQPASRPRIHTFIATSPVHRKSKLRLNRAQVLERVREMVSYARERCEDIEFSPEDAGRTEPEYLWEVVETAIASGATTVNIPDTVGYTHPQEFAAIIQGIRKNVRGIQDVIVSVHCHNDLGLGTANTLAGIQAGARQAEVTINGIGERAGNTALEECVMALRTRRDVYRLDTAIDTQQIAGVSRLVSHITGMAVQPNKAIVGANAFAHEAGIHQDGMLKDEHTYEIMVPTSVGVPASRMVLGKHSGRHAFAARLAGLGYELDDETLIEVFGRFKSLAERKKVVTDSDLISLVCDQVGKPEEFYRLGEVNLSCGTGMRTATVSVTSPDGKTEVQAAVGSGPVEAVFRAIDAVVDVKCILVDYELHAATEGKNALGEAAVKIRHADDESVRDHPQHGNRGPRVFHGHGVNQDIIEASAQAYVTAINKLLASHKRHGEGMPAIPDLESGDVFARHGVDTGAPPEGSGLWSNGDGSKAGRQVG
jgi:2-isopropylmalate synthase